MYIDKLIGFFGEEGPESARKEINREKFESWFERYKEECEGYSREEWNDVGSLYDL
jgi:hypothetical protein